MHSDPVTPASKAGGTQLLCALILVATASIGWFIWNGTSQKVTARPRIPVAAPRLTPEARLNFAPRRPMDTSGTPIAFQIVERWADDASLEDLRTAFHDLGKRSIDRIERDLAGPDISDEQKFSMLMTQSFLWNYEGNPSNGYKALEKARSLAETDDQLYAQSLYSLIMFQGVSGLRRGENENCILCRGESSCILPISLAAVHTNPDGSRLAIHHFTEYLARFPDDLEVRWLLNLAHMTLGEYPDRVDPRYLISIEHFTKSEHNIGKFRDIGHIVGVNRLNQAGGAIMDDFDNDGLLDIVTTTMDAAGPMAFYRNDGKGHFENRAEAAGLGQQLGGLNCVQTDYNNDGYLDIFVERGAWFTYPMRPSLLRNNPGGGFTDVTEEAGLMYPVNSISSTWADYDNDGWLDLFICCERQPSRLYRNLGNGKFEYTSETAGLDDVMVNAKGANWIDYDNEDDPDLMITYQAPSVGSQLFRNNGNGTFSDVTMEMGVQGPNMGFSCWAWDYDNDGWLDLFATCYDRSLTGAIKGLQGLPHGLHSSALYHNRQGKGFEDVAKEAGLDMVMMTMGSNFADFDNDGYLDMYLGTGEPQLTTLIPNRMFKNISGQRFSEITASSGTGNLQKGHGVACGDWDRDGNTDIFIEMGGAVPGDQYHNILFQNPGNHGNSWLALKLIGQESNRAAIGARIKVVTGGEQPRTIYRHVSTGSSFGANSLQQTIGLGETERIATLEIRWPKSKSTQVFSDIDVNQAIEITEFATDYVKLDRKRIALPK